MQANPHPPSTVRVPRVLLVIGPQLAYWNQCIAGKDHTPIQALEQVAKDGGFELIVEGNGTKAITMDGILGRLPDDPDLPVIFQMHGGVESEDSEHTTVTGEFAFGDSTEDFIRDLVKGGVKRVLIAGCGFGHLMDTQTIRELVKKHGLQLIVIGGKQEAITSLGYLDIKQTLEFFGECNRKSEQDQSQGQLYQFMEANTPQCVRSWYPGMAYPRHRDGLKEIPANVEPARAEQFTRALFLQRVHRGDTETVEKLLLTGSIKDIDTPLAVLGFIPLGLAASRGDLEMMNLLLKYGSDVNRRNEFGWTALVSAADAGHVDAIELLLRSGANLETETIHGTTAICVAVEKNNLAACGALLTGGANVMRLFNGKSLFCRAIAMKKGAVEMFKQLMAAPGLDRNAAIKLADDQGKTPIFYAAMRDAAMVNLVHIGNGGINLTTKDKSGDTPLSIAVGHGCLDVIEYLKSRGGDVCEKFERGQTLLHVAAKSGKRKAFGMLLATGKLGVDAVDDRGETPLFQAVRSNQLPMIKYLSRRGADVNRASLVGATPIQVAVMGARAPVAVVLVECGAVLTPITSHQFDMKRAAAWAAENNLVEVTVQAMDEADIHTLLGTAARCASADVAKELLLRKADPNRADAQGRTPMVLAAERQDGDMVDAFVKAAPLDVSISASPKALGLILSCVIDNRQEQVALGLMQRKDFKFEVEPRTLSDMLILAIDEGRTAIVRTLLQCKPVDLTGHHFGFLFLRAVTAGHVDVVRELMDRGADFNEGSWMGTPLSYARKKGFESIVALLLERGAKE